MPTPEALVSAAQSAGARINRRRPPASATGASLPTSPTPAPPARQDLSGATGGTLTGEHGGVQQLGEAAQRRLAAFRPPPPAAAPPPPPPVAPPAWKQLLDAGVQPTGTAAGNRAAAANLAGAMPDGDMTAQPMPLPVDGGTPPPPAIARGIRAFRPQTGPEGPEVSAAPPRGMAPGTNVLTATAAPGSYTDPTPALPPEIAQAIQARLQSRPADGVASMEKPLLGARPPIPEGPAPPPWDELAGALSRRRMRPPGGAGLGDLSGGGGMGDLAGQKAY